MGTTSDAQPGKRLARLMNIVHNDEIWKDHIRHEHVSARHRWPETWGYLVYEYRKMNNELGGRSQSAKVSGSLRYSSYAVDGLKLPVIPERQRDFPRTTSQEIGWKSTQKGNTVDLNRFAEQRRGKCTLIRRLNWPNQASV